jgi:hypothetical protein
VAPDVRENPRVDKVVTKLPLHRAARSAPENLAFWLNQPVAARIAAVEVLRNQQNPELAHAEQRLQRVCRVAQRQRR